MNVGQTADLVGFSHPTVGLQAWLGADWPVAPDWAPLVERFWASSAGQHLSEFGSARLAAKARVYPPEPLRALQITSLASVRVVILGQDPYHGAGQAEGLAFSVASGMAPPPSLRNVYKDLVLHPAAQIFPLPANPQKDGSLLAWAERGVLLLNTCLTVEEGKPSSHTKQGWEALTDAIVIACAQKREPVAFLLWGAHAQTKRTLIEAAMASSAVETGNSGHLVLVANHPSPLSAARGPLPFLGCAHFQTAEQFLSGVGARAKPS